MKQVFCRHRRLYIWLLADLTLLASYLLLRGNRACMNAAAGFTRPLRAALGRLSYLVDFSVMEVLCVLAGLAALAYLAWSVISVIRAERGRRGGRAWTAALGAVCAAGTVAALFCLLWGVDYWTDSFQDLSGIRAGAVSRDDLLSVTERFAQELTEASDDVPRDENGLFAVPREEILSQSPVVYDQAEALFPFLEFDDTGVKPMFFSRFMSATGFTGVYCPFTGEANVNVDSPACLLPSTAAHEMAHQRGFASEQECNFLAVLASTTSGLPAYVYAGYLMGFIHLGNALYSVDPDTYWAIRHALPETVQSDLNDNNAYWAQFDDTALQKASNTFYDGMLKAYGDEDGIRSYGTVVDLLVAYYCQAAESAAP